MGEQLKRDFNSINEAMFAVILQFINSMNEEMSNFQSDDLLWSTSWMPNGCR